MLLSNFLIGTLCGILFLLVKNIVQYDILGLELQFLKNLRPDQVSTDVQSTSRLVSGFRALDSNRANSVYFQQDPLATVMAGSYVATLEEEASEIFRTPAETELHSVTLRQLAIDRRIRQHCNSSDQEREDTQLPPIRQVVLIGAGLDTRPYRLSLPHTNWFEVDMPEVLALKETLLAGKGVTSSSMGLSLAQSESIGGSTFPLRVKTCTRIAFNLKDEELTNEGTGTANSIGLSLSVVLATHGHVATEPTLFLMEGLVMYLSPSEIRSLMHSILPVAAPKSRVILTQVSLKMHYLLTNPLVVFCIEKLSKSKSHQVATLFKSNLFSTDLGHEWTVQSIVNIGSEMWTTKGLVQWQPKNHVEGTPPQLVSTAEYILDVVLV